MIRAVVVDMDDTLCLTEAICFELENDVLARMGRAPMSRQVHQATWGQPLFEAMLLRSPGIDLNAFGVVFTELFRQYFADGRIDVIPEENLAALDELADAGRDIMLLTSRTLPEVGHLLADGHALAKRLTAAFHAGNTRFRKPDPRVFDELLSASGLQPEHCVYVGDSPGDAAAAKGAGLRFIASLQSGLRQRSDFASYHVDGFIDVFPDVVKVLPEL